MDERRSRGAAILAVGVAVALGMLGAVQIRINGQLGATLGNGYLAALISFTVGLAIVTIALLVSRAARAGLGLLRTAIRERTAPFWYLFSGAAGAFVVVTQGLTAALLGVAAFTVAMVCGQVIAGLILDAKGLGTMAARRLSPPRIVGAVLALAAVALAVSSAFTQGSLSAVLLLPLLSGAAFGWQQAVNGQVRVVTASPIAAAWVSFAIGTAVLVIVVGVSVGILGWPERLPGELWLYFGGLIGALIVGASTILVRIIGVLVLGLAMVAGQLTMSVILDLLFPVANHEVTALTVVGTALTLVAVGISAIGSRPVQSAVK